MTTRNTVAKVHRIWYINVGKMSPDRAIKFVNKFKKQQEQDSDFKREDYIDYYVPADYTQVIFQETSI